METGVYNFTDAEYHSDPAPEPSMSRSFAVALMNGNPAKAAYMHPRLNKDFEPHEDKKFDLGKAAHDYFLCGGDKVVSLEYDDYRKKEAQTARDGVIKCGKLPVLQKQFSDIENMSKSIATQVKNLKEDSDGFTDGLPERAFLWKDQQGFWMRCKPDWHQPAVDGVGGWIDDLKTTNVSSPEQWMKTVMYDKGYDIQAAMDMEGYEAVYGVKPKGVRFFVMEATAPHCVYVVVLNDVVLAQAREKLAVAKRIFYHCLKSGQWGGYSNRRYEAYPSYLSDAQLMTINAIADEISDAGTVEKTFVKMR